MKAVRSSMLVMALVLSGCASSGSASGAQEGVSWWNPLSYHWSAALPWHWFGSSLKVSDQGVGGLNGSTSMDQAAINSGLNGDYQLRQGMRGHNGDVINFWQALDDGKVKLVVYGTTQVSRIEVLDADIASTDGRKVGDRFSDTFSKAFGQCELASDSSSSSTAVECKVPGSQHLRYVYSGEWHGPEGLMPADDTLKNWTISKIVWQR
ncbi:RpoE-regulated lipoprotein [Candidatus Pantoea multigeneris]|uniref:RpoE-regulated lipoprotein n=1 Tax=Candidatus Pantoea multigeneris TaxID=2608357 RepID=A0ABX0RBT5_9GAMM|nr:RpoE-regulated lipoprotein [Pantoea multigeneris]NIF20939.1 RpoE-regulated lipoprotein [Pantoea multigeneris]